MQTVTAEYSKVRLEDGVLSITISTADHGASLDSEGVAQGTRALTELGDRIGSILLRGTGPNFCAGGNVRGFAAAPDRGAHVADVAENFHGLVRALDAARVPIVAGVQGWAAGAGMSLVCLADIALGGPATKLRPAYPTIGFTPDGGMSWTLPRIVGSGRAREILLTDSVLGADEAARLGILSRLVGDDLVQDEALRLARAIAVGPTSAYEGIKTLLAESRTNSLDRQLDAEAASIARAANSPAGREGVDAFVEKRRADFAPLHSH
ncbi:2-(1,2-epoxy-1,2-dihydrophenyl)acetyl-CoA isomerase [Rhodococcus triatomae]|uniref:2-(1,2-epoxy-1,2-dihydrophenyl)acetyl-CoA isomerase n=1 Tax=Rhodococcus triatomae TaxID=300028 RepID=A0A1G8ENX6_9NOCA|nr:2-(1,2-epoxy-1,2-dihydrophenyl)acetyl-CoA isomerase [Rhodococcus triatomae]